MKRLLLFSALMIALSFLLPLLLLPGAGSGEAPAETGEESPSPAAEDGPEGAEDAAEKAEGEPVTDSDILLSVLTDEGVVSMTMAEYLPGALAGEMPASFDSEALKAQAVALRSYVLYCRDERKSSHPEADVCTSPACCTAWSGEETLRDQWGSGYAAYAEKIRRAVSDTDGQYLVWEEEPILAVFHSSSAGQTESGGNLWSDKPYLLSVSSPETEADVSNLVTTVEVGAEEFRTSVARLYPGASFDGEPSSWLGETVCNSSGRVASVTIGGAAVTGTALRSLFSLRSTDFDLAWSGESFVFTVRGYGHGVGMSQYGANVMAKSGSGYAEILAHYYPGTELVVAVRQSS